MPAWVCACVCVCECQLCPQARQLAKIYTCVHAWGMFTLCVCVCVWASLPVDCTNTYTVCPSPPHLEKSTHLPPNGKSMCRQCVQRGSSCATHTYSHSLSRFLHSNHSTIIIIPFIILVQRSVNVLMTLEWVLHFCCWFRRLTLNCAYYLYIRNQLTISFVYYCAVAPNSVKIAVN